MNMPPSGLLGAGAGLLALGLAVTLGLGALKRQEARRGRMQAVLGPLHPASPVATPRRTLLQTMAEFAPLRWLAGCLRLQINHAADYPIRWWLVPVIALPLARAAAGLLAVLAGDAALLATLPVWLLLCRSIYEALDRRRREILFRQFPDALGMITRAIRVGIPIAEAIRAVTREMPKETADEFRRIADRLAIGLSMEQSLSETAHHNGVQEYRFFATALSLQSTTGGGLGETLENLSDVIRKRVALKERGFALAAEARTSAAILAALPFFTTGVMAIMNPSYVGVLFHDPGGQRILAIAVGLMLLGMAIMRGMIRKSLA
ncbi:type II secretion system F family protein [Paeniroseomonas aquatica]|uniref:Type II secretion system F family protein n=1 Tax=Paeniroseomonas aquatica TaxID=373043 RepID=A0ABT8AGC4_9PROT|nr:type II secretion system F family protein [Paeniroseomonas aquatica]MDN3568409.1 type II secretion system F family protein [Paeniroseomonas aquatica]